MNKKEILIYVGIGVIVIIGGLYIYSKRKKPMNQTTESNNSNPINNFNSSITDTPEWSSAK